MFKVGQKVTLKRLMDLIDEGTLVQEELEFGRIGDVSSALEGCLIRRSNYSTSIILLSNEVNYLGKTGEVMVYSPNDVFFNWDGTEMLAEPERPLALRMEDGYIIRLVPDFLVTTQEYNSYEDDLRYYKQEVAMQEKIIDHLLDENDRLHKDVQHMADEIESLKRLLQLERARR